MTRAQLIRNIRTRRSFLCIGLDPDPAFMPEGMDVLEFNRAIIDATRNFCVAYKPNTAFYESMGTAGWEILEKTIAHIGRDHFIIADAKRGDIGNSSTHYAHAFFERFSCDAITVSPYMGEDSVKPFLNYPGKWAIVLALTSNPGAVDFEMQPPGDPLYARVLRQVAEWGNKENLMFVVGATRPELLAEVRAIVPDHFLLVPGIGAQGGSLNEVVQYGFNSDVGLLVNVSRSILYASGGSDFAEAAGWEAERLRNEMASFL